MSDDSEPGKQNIDNVMPPSHGRILVIMAMLGLFGGFAGMAYHSASFGFGVWFGCGLAFVNYYWLKNSLRRTFESAAEGEKPKVSAIRYILRYFTMGAIIALVFITDALPIVAVILGMAGFGFAVVVEGIIRILSYFFNAREI